MPRGLSNAEVAQQKVNRAMIDGVGGLEFVAQAPPGIGRLIRIPFYQVVATAGYVSLFGQTAAAVAAGFAAGVASTTHPTITLAPPAAAGATATAALLTPQISWAILRIVGFECDVRDPVLPPAAVMEMAFSDLQIGGGANLFVHEDFAPASIYLMGQDSFAGLRDYPLLKSPNQAQVQVQGVGLPASAPVTFSCNLVCEILQDDNYGAHVPGPYARPGALVRQGGGFVTS